MTRDHIDRRNPIKFGFACAVAIVIFLSGGLANSFGAVLHRSDSKLCAFTLNGTIIAGDSDRLAALLADSHLDPLDERTTYLCLHSNGGEFDEAIKLSELLYDRGLSTVVIDGAECYSACAIVFMSGVITDRAAPHRKLSVGAVVGFHAPYLPPRDGRYSAEQVDQSLQDMRKAILALLRIASRKTQLASTDFLKKSLIARILESGPKEVSVVRTIADAARWNIDIYDAEERFPQPSPANGMINLCNNFHYGNMDESISSSPELSLRIESFTQKYKGEDSRIIAFNSFTNDTVCEIYPFTFKGKEDILFRACSYDYWSSKSFGDCREYKTGVLFGQYVPGFFRLPPDTVLKNSK